MLDMLASEAVAAATAAEGHGQVQAADDPFLAATAQLKRMEQELADMLSGVLQQQQQQQQLTGSIEQQQQQIEQYDEAQLAAAAAGTIRLNPSTIAALTTNEQLPNNNDAAAGSGSDFEIPDAHDDLAPAAAAAGSDDAVDEEAVGQLLLDIASRYPSSATSSRPWQQQQQRQQNPRFSNRICDNCKITDSCLWRTDPVDRSRTLCNACGLFKKKRGKDRPLARTQKIAAAAAAAAAANAYRNLRNKINKQQSDQPGEQQQQQQQQHMSIPDVNFILPCREDESAPVTLHLNVTDDETVQVTIQPRQQQQQPGQMLAPGTTILHGVTSHNHQQQQQWVNEDGTNCRANISLLLSQLQDAAAADAPAAPAAAGSSKKRSHPMQQQQPSGKRVLLSAPSGGCYNCGREDSVVWRKDPDNPSNVLCNACGVYKKKNGRDRPKVDVLSRHSCVLFSGPGSGYKTKGREDGKVDQQDEPYIKPEQLPEQQQQQCEQIDMVQDPTLDAMQLHQQQQQLMECIEPQLEPTEEDVLMAECTLPDTFAAAAVAAAAALPADFIPKTNPGSSSSGGSRSSSRQPGSRRASITPPTAGCANCSCMVSPVWRRDPFEYSRILCNACALYKKSNGQDRPKSSVLKSVLKKCKQAAAAAAAAVECEDPQPQTEGQAALSIQQQGTLDPGHLLAEQQQQQQQQHDALPVGNTRNSTSRRKPPRSNSGSLSAAATAAASGSSKVTLSALTRLTNNGSSVCRCSNCGTTRTCLWRSDRGDFTRILCNACALYKKQWGKDKPVSDGKASRASSSSSGSSSSGRAAAGQQVVENAFGDSAFAPAAAEGQEISDLAAASGLAAVAAAADVFHKDQQAHTSNAATSISAAAAAAAALLASTRTDPISSSNGSSMTNSVSKYKRRIPGHEQVCANCAESDSSIWRRDQSNTCRVLCNACGLFKNRTGRDRPVSKWMRVGSTGSSSRRVAAAAAAAAAMDDDLDVVEALIAMSGMQPDDGGCLDQDQDHEDQTNPDHDQDLEIADHIHDLGNLQQEDHEVGVLAAVADAPTEQQQQVDEQVDDHQQQQSEQVEMDKSSLKASMLRIAAAVAAQTVQNVTAEQQQQQQQQPHGLAMTTAANMLPAALPSPPAAAAAVGDTRVLLAMASVPY